MFSSAPRSWLGPCRGVRRHFHGPPRPPRQGTASLRRLLIRGDPDQNRVGGISSRRACTVARSTLGIRLCGSATASSSEDRRRSVAKAHSETLLRLRSAPRASGLIGATLPSTFGIPGAAAPDAADVVEGQSREAETVVLEVELNRVLAGRQRLSPLSDKSASCGGCSCVGGLRLDRGPAQFVRRGVTRCGYPRRTPVADRSARTVAALSDARQGGGQQQIVAKHVTVADDQARLQLENGCRRGALAAGGGRHGPSARSIP